MCTNKLSLNSANVILSMCVSVYVYVSVCVCVCVCVCVYPRAHASSMTFLHVFHFCYQKW